MEITRLGVMGGTFNPIHLGHLMIAEEARQAFHLKKVLFVPSYITPNKDVCGATAEQRLAMTRLATADNPYFTVSDMEMRRHGKFLYGRYAAAFKRNIRPVAQPVFHLGDRYDPRPAQLEQSGGNPQPVPGLSVRPVPTARNRSIPSSRPLASWGKTFSNCRSRRWKSLRQNSGAAFAWACPSAI